MILFQLGFLGLPLLQGERLRRCGTVFAVGCDAAAGRTELGRFWLGLLLFGPKQGREVALLGLNTRPVRDNGGYFG